MKRSVLIASLGVSILIGLLAGQLMLRLRLDSFLRSSSEDTRKSSSSSVHIVNPPAAVNPCHGYRGVLHIRHGDPGAAGTAMFFNYVINYIHYAEKYNLLPWIHLDNISHRVYDTEIHGDDPHTIILSTGMYASRQPGHRTCRKLPIGRPVNKTPLERTSITVFGNGVWEAYFEPVSAFSLGNPCHPDDPYLTFTQEDRVSVHYHWTESVRFWQYAKCSRPAPQHDKLHEWYGMMRGRAYGIVNRYIKPKPWLQELVDRANPVTKPQSCLALHVRLTDKSGNRATVGVDAYLPYAKAYAKQAQDGTIYLGTDSSVALRNMTRDWPVEVVAKIRTAPQVLRSGNATAVFDIGSHHRTNTEILTEVYAMAKCQLFVHGHSGVSESTHFLNPSLHNCSVDLEDPRRPTVEDFLRMVERCVRPGL